jgi:glycosyltransferase involved in cell wall biosynthesis
MISSKSIIILTPGFPVDENDTNCLPSQQLFVRSLNKLFPEIKVIIISLQYPAHNTPYLWFGNTVIPLDGKSYNKFLKPLFWIRSIKSVIRIAKEENVSSIISFWCQETALIGIHVSKRLGIAHKIWICGQDARKENMWLKLMKPEPHALVAMSDFLSKEFSKNHGISPAHIVKNGIEKSLFSKSNLSKDIDVIGVGSLIPLKQYDKFIEVVEKIKITRPAVKVMLVGNGPERKRLEKLIAIKNLSSTIALPGELPHEQTIQLLERSKVLLHPSSYEGYSTVCLEALYASCDVISFTFAENTKISNWMIVQTIEEMAEETVKILSSRQTPERVLVNSMDQAAADFMTLLNHAE